MHQWTISRAGFSNGFLELLVVGGQHERRITLLLSVIVWIIVDALSFIRFMLLIVGQSGPVGLLVACGKVSSVERRTVQRRLEFRSTNGTTYEEPKVPPGYPRG